MWNLCPNCHRGEVPETVHRKSEGSQLFPNFLKNSQQLLRQKLYCFRQVSHIHHHWCSAPDNPVGEGVEEIDNLMYGRMFSGIPGCYPLDANCSPIPKKNTSRLCQSFAGVQGGGVLNFKTSLLKHYLILTSIKETSSDGPVCNSTAK